MRVKYPNLLFDLDGTLVDSAPDILACVKRAFVEGLGAAEPEVRADLIGLQLREILLGVDPALSAGDIEKLGAAFRRIYDDCGFPGTRLYPGAAETLARLSAAGVRLYLATNKPSRPTAGILRKFGLEVFEGVVCPDSLPGRKLTKSQMVGHALREYRLDAPRTAMVGDSEQDLLAARENGIASVAALYGYGNGVRLRGLGPAHLIEEISALPALLS